MVSGGPDAGRFTRTITIGCATCGQLADVATEQFGADMLGSGDLPPCATCGSTAVAEWSRGQPCPRCEKPVEPTGQRAMLWD